MTTKYFKAIMVSTMILSCPFIGGAAENTPSPEVRSVSAQTFNREISDNDVEIVDVRTPEEYAEGYIGGAINIDVQSPDFPKEAAMALDRTKTIYVYCRSGKRSLKAAEELMKLGYKVVNLKGGIMEWTGDELPVVNTTGTDNR